MTAAGLGRLFEGGGFLLPVVAVTLSAQVSSWVARRLGWGSGAGLLAGWLSVAVAATWTVLPGSVAGGLVPGPATLQVALEALRAVPAQLRLLAAPAPPTTGLVLSASLGCGAGAVFADWAAFRAGFPEAALAPGLATLVVTGGLGTGGGRLAEPLAWTMAVAAFLIALRVEGLEAKGWPQRLRRVAVGGGALMVAIALPAGALLSRVLPGSGARALVLWHRPAGRTNGTRFAVSPLVSIRGQLLAPSSQVAFVVRSPVPSYWRLTALDSFNGTVWSSDQTYGLAKGRLPGKVQGASTIVKDHFSIVGLSNIWLPAAYRPIALSGAPGARFDAGSGSIVVPGASPSGLSYTVQSRLPQLSPAALRTAVVSTNSITAARNLQLPPGIPSSVIALAHRLVAGHRTPFGKALALETFFRRNFTYSLSASPSNSTSAMTRFLFESRSGYCQQFAGTYAVMARAVGLPARVAVGFTYGQETSPGTWVVRALDAHAWPEVLLGRFGWVPFEPTPGRGNPAAVDYTHVTPAEASVPPAGAGIGQPAAAASAAPAPAAAAGPRTAAGRMAHPAGATGQSERRSSHGSHPSAGKRRRSTIGGAGSGAGGSVLDSAGAKGVAGAAAGVLVLAVSVLLVAFLGRFDRRPSTAKAKGEPDGAAGAAEPDRRRAIDRWSDVAERLSEAGFQPPAAVSVTAFARSMASTMGGEAGAALIRLAEAAAWAYYSAPGTPVPEPNDPQSDCTLVAEAARALGAGPRRGTVRTGA